MPDQTSFEERLKRLEQKEPSATFPAPEPEKAPREAPSFNYGKAILAFSAVFLVSMAGLLVFTLQQTSG